MDLKAHEQSGNSWVIKTYPVRGGWNIAVDGEGLVLNLESDFQTGDGPDLEVYVTSQNIADIGSRDRAESPPQRVRIGIMPRARGEQSYLLPTENLASTTQSSSTAGPTWPLFASSARTQTQSSH